MVKVLYALVVLVAILILVGKQNTQQLAGALVELIQAFAGLLRSSLR